MMRTMLLALTVAAIVVAERGDEQALLLVEVVLGSLVDKDVQLVLILIELPRTTRMHGKRQ